MFKKLSVWTQYLLPKQLLTEIAGKLANKQAGALTTVVIRWFINRHQVNMPEAAQSDATHYSTFNEFFTRPLKSGVRPLAQAKFVSPVDGAISQFGKIQTDQIFQAKGHQYSTATMLAGDIAFAKTFEDGEFATLYLSPKDYHRIHMPCDGRLIKMTYVPGDLFSVNPTTAEGVPGLFARNERVICEFEASFGRFALILVGATIVGSMATAWHGIVNPPRSKTIRTWEYANQNIALKQGEEMGRFLLGSTVVMLFPPQSIQFNPEWAPTKPIRMGELMGN